jgi:hypothetical protein
MTRIAGDTADSLVLEALNSTDPALVKTRKQAEEVTASAIAS